MNRLTRTMMIGRLLKPLEDGGLSLLGTRANIVAVFVDVFRQKLMEEELGYKKASSIIYNVGQFTGQQAWNLIAKKKGMEKRMPLKKLFEYNLGQSEFIGRGKLILQLFNLKEKIFVLHLTSSFAKEYKRLFGNSKNCVDHIYRGMAAAFGKAIFKEPCLCIETKCIAKGNEICEFIVKPTKKFKLKKKEKDLFLMESMPSFKELGAKKEPYA